MKVPKVEFHGGLDPLHSRVQQDGFDSGQAGVSHTLRDHNGKKASRGAVESTAYVHGEGKHKVRDY